MARFARAHGSILAVLVVGTVLRALTTVAYRPALAFFQDSFDYLDNADRLTPSPIRPFGYPFFLRLASVTGRLELVPVAQHLLGLAAGTLLYVLLRRLGAPSWLAALGAAPVLLDGYQIYLEHFVMAEALFEALVVTALALLLWVERPGPIVCAASGGLLAASALTRSVGLVLLVPALAFLAARRVGPVALAGAAGASLAVLGGYAVWFDVAHGQVALQAYGGYFLAGRVEPFADCAGLRFPPREQPLCDGRPRAERPNADWYVWNPDAPLRRLDPSAAVDRNELAANFARRVIRHQPGDYLRSVAADTAHYFAMSRATGADDFPVDAWRFRTDFVPDVWHPVAPPPDPYTSGWTSPGPSVANGVTVAAHGFGLAQVRPALHRPAATVLARYQRYGYTNGPILAAGLLLGLLAGAGRLADPHQRRLRHAGALCAVGGVALLLSAAATSVFDFRYLLPVLVLLPPAGAIGLTLVLDRRRPPAGG